MDLLIKKVGGEYVENLSRNLVENVCTVFSKVSFKYLLIFMIFIFFCLRKSEASY